MRLSALVRRDVDPDPEITGVTADSRKVKPGYLFAALPGSKTDGRALRRRGADGRRRRRARRRDDRRALAAPVVQRLRPAPRLRAGRRRLLGRAARDLRRRHRHQRQDLGRRPSAARSSSASAAAPPAWARWACSAGERADHAAGPDHARRRRRRARCWPTSPRAASPTWRWKPPRTASTSAGWTACALTAAGFPNLTQDHLDYHGDMAAYRAAKLRLFEALLPRGATAVLNADSDAFPPSRPPRRRPARPSSPSARWARDCTWRRATPIAGGQRLRDRSHGRAHRRRPAARRRLPGLQRPGRRRPLHRRRRRDRGRCWRRWSISKAPPGRLQRIGAGRERRRGLRRLRPHARWPETVLKALRPHARGRLIVVVRRRRRPRPRQAAADGRDRRQTWPISPSSPTTIRAREDPAAIRARDPGRRAGRCARSATGARPSRSGRRHAGRRRRAGGRRQGPRAGPDRRRDHPSVRRRGRDRRGARPGGGAWLSRSGPPTRSSRRDRRTLTGAPFAATGVSIDTRTLEPGDLFVALAGERDGHEFVRQALADGRGRRPGRQRRSAGPRSSVGDTLSGAGAPRASPPASARRSARARRGHRLGRQDQRDPGDRAPGWRAPAAAHASVKSYNNHIGVPLTLARMPRDDRAGGLRDRHEPRRRDHPAGRAWSRRRRWSITNVGAGAHRELRRRRGGRRPRQGGDLRGPGSRAARRC